MTKEASTVGGTSTLQGTYSSKQSNDGNSSHGCENEAMHEIKHQIETFLSKKKSKPQTLMQSGTHTISSVLADHHEEKQKTLINAHSRNSIRMSSGSH